MGFLRPEGKVHIAPLAKGSVAETHTVAALARCGYFPLLPAIAGGRYDLVFEDAEGNFWRVQVKTGRYKDGSIEFHTKSNSVKGSYRVRLIISRFTVLTWGRSILYLSLK